MVIKQRIKSAYGGGFGTLKRSPEAKHNAQTSSISCLYNQQSGQKI